jgi:hypothetical protein
VKRSETTREAVSDRLRAHERRGFHVDSRLLREVDAPGCLSLLTLESQDEFLRLIWQATTDTRPLAPPGGARTLGDCAARLSAFQWSFRSLVEAGHSWFEKCISIDAEFVLDNIGWVAVTPSLPTELGETPHGTLYVYDGVHKALVLAKKLLHEEVSYTAVEALLLEPRRN